MSQKTKKVLVAGGSGFIGSNLIRELLRKGYEVHIILRKESNTWRLDDIKKSLHIHYGDLTDREWIEKEVGHIKPTYIFNLSQYGGHPKEKDPAKTWDVNLNGTVHLLDAAQKVGFERFVHVGSSSEYGRKNKSMREDDIVEPNTIYGVSKASATLYCMHKAREDKLPVVVLRFFAIYGPWEGVGRLMNAVSLASVRGKPVDIARSDIARDFVYVDDAVEACMKAAINKKAVGHVFNICSGVQTTLKQVVETARVVSKKPLEARWGTIEARSFDTGTWVGDPTQSKKVLGWKAATPFAKGLKKTIAWFEEHKNLYHDR